MVLKGARSESDGHRKNETYRNDTAYWTRETARRGERENARILIRTGSTRNIKRIYLNNILTLAAERP